MGGGAKRCCGVGRDPAECARGVLAAPPRDGARGARRRDRARVEGSGQAAALATRERKQYGIETHTWLEEVRARAGELGLGRDELDGLASDARDRLTRRVERATVDERELGERLVGPLGLTERTNAFDRRDVIQAFADAAAQGALVPEVLAQADRFTRRPDVLETARGGFTTADLLASEKRLIEAAVGRADAAVGVLDAVAVDAVLARLPRQLTREQAEVVRAVAASGRGVEVVEALAGTGKTTTAGVIRAVYEDAGYEVIGVAPTGRSARELAEQAGVASRTIDRLLIDIEQLGDTLPTTCVVVFDEAGMAPTRSTARLLETAERAGAKVVAIGDPGQLASVQAGGWLRAVGRQVGALRLTEVMRQRDPGERRALSALHDRLPKPYLDWAARTGRVDTFADPTTARERAVAEWADAIATVGPSEAVLIARDNDTRDALNHAARAHRRALGELGVERSYGGIEFAIGDRVICRRNDRLLDVDNGTRGTVRHLDEDRVVIETDSRLVRELPAGYVAEHVEHAYALTGHGMQGATVEHAIVVASPRELTAGWSYTALSRARERTRLLIHDDHSDHTRADIAPTHESAPSARDELIARAARRMVERDDEDLAIDQLPRAGHADDSALTESIAREPAQEHAAIRAEPAVADISPEHFRALRDRLERLTTQRAALPLAKSQRLEEIDARILHTTATRDDSVAALESIPPPSRRVIGPTRDPHLVDRHRLRSQIDAADKQLTGLHAERSRTVAELGQPEQIRSELDGLTRAITPLTDQYRSMRDQLTEQALASPPSLATRTLGDRPTGSRASEWDRAVRMIVRYRLDHDITDPDRPLGPRPPSVTEREEWQRAGATIDSYQIRLGRDRDAGLEVDISDLR